MTIIEKTFPAFREAFIKNKPNGATTRFFLIRNGSSIPLFGAAVLADGKFYVNDVNRTYYRVLDSDEIQLQ